MGRTKIYSHSQEDDGTVQHHERTVSWDESVDVIEDEHGNLTMTARRQDPRPVIGVDGSGKLEMTPGPTRTFSRGHAEWVSPEPTEEQVAAALEVLIERRHEAPSEDLVRAVLEAALSA